MSTPPISYQLYCSRNFPPLPRQTEMLAGIGIKHVEPFSGLFNDMTALQTALGKNGLTAPTAHVGVPDFRNDFDGTIAKLKSIGVATAIVPAVPQNERVQDAEGWKKLGRELAGYTRRAADHGLAFAWHNHSFEFAQLPDGTYPLELILGEDPALKWQCDIAWTIRGKQDPVAWIKRYEARVMGFHVKDMAPEGELADEDGWADVGYGVMDWNAMLPVMRATPSTVWTLEHDNPKDDARFARRSFETVSRW